MTEQRELTVDDIVNLYWSPLGTERPIGKGRLVRELETDPFDGEYLPLWRVEVTELHEESGSIDTELLGGTWDFYVNPDNAYG